MNLNGKQVSGKQYPKWTNGFEELWLATNSRRTFVPGRGTEFTTSLTDSRIRFEHGEYGNVWGR